MKSIVKKIVVFSMIGVMQVGIGAATIEASPRHHDNPNERYERRHHDNDREQRLREEKARHEREMQRRHYESEREYKERQEREKDHHEEIMRTIGGLALLAMILNNNN